MKQQAKGLDAIFEIETIDSKEIDIVDECSDLVIVDESKDESDTDFIRSELRDLITKTKLALETATNAQKEDSIARNSEAVAGLLGMIDKSLNTLINLNKSNLSSKKNEIPNIPNIQNSNVIIATSEEIISRITSELKNKGQ